MESEPETMDGSTFIPGTVHLVDLEGTMHTKHASGGHRDIVLVPTPSNDPNDPLNWSPRRKLLSTTCMCVYTLMVGIASALIYSVETPITEATELTLDNLNSGTGYLFLLAGWGCLFWQPIALQYGKRPVYLISTLANTAIQIWAPHTKTNGQWIAKNILQGFFSAPIESLCEISITDLYFTHERGFYMALYALFLAGSNFLAPILAGFINDGQGWQWVLYWGGIFCGIGFVFLFFFMEETNYHRALTTNFISSSGNQTPSPQAHTSPEVIDEKKVAPEMEQCTLNDTETGIAQSYKEKTYLQKIALFQKADLGQPNRLLGMVQRPLIFLTFPVIFFSGFSYGSYLVWFNVLNGTSSLILGNSPYNFKSSMVGLSYISTLLGVIVAAIYTGKFGDWFMIRLARKRNGIMEPEYRLWLFGFCVVALPFGLILWGVGAAHHVHWFGLLFAMGVIACCNTIGITLSVNYCIDSYRDLSGEAIITVIVVRNTMSFAIGYGLTPWVTDMGYQNAFIVAAFIGLAQALTFLVFVKYGKTLRKRSIARYWKYVKEIEKAGLKH
ncbi:MAG: hypothetical protein M1834_007461 [Cirrosporium novae-zelandiae]|nr:MAG: hypothetical protein M1834_007461 [Cirrosporium novae-zelandiae]